MLDPAFAKRVNAGGGMPKPVVVVDGKVHGVWKREEKLERMVLAIEAFQRLVRRSEAASRRGRNGSVVSNYCGMMPISMASRKGDQHEKNSR